MISYARHPLPDLNLHRLFADDGSGHREARQRATGLPGHQTAPDTSARPCAPEAAVSLTKRGEAYAAAHDRGDAIVLTLDRHDRIGLATTIERLINLLDDLDGDPDLEPSLGYGQTSGKGCADVDLGDDREEEETDHNGDEHDYGKCEDDAMALELYCIPFGPLVGGQGL